eukprot:CAMPEP_0179213018 /NCGR_PEP_ID=MMETSP0797-20121207/1438_1 /TAXON_ID=47934 /ORGANISM="Dinophysis acuminata, Strain DAEP01" /LENGTH=320 /DNA_ID=CAMNT_0020918715 /DNA_START=57 /DNA_END=1019 /DNA_ORIENTATION=-
MTRDGTIGLNIRRCFETMAASTSKMHTDYEDGPEVDCISLRQRNVPDEGHAHLPRSRLQFIPGRRMRKIVPHILYVVSPHGQHACEGAYIWLADETPNGQPLWKLAHGDYWLYSGTTGRWCIGGPDVRQEDFDRSAGYVYQTIKHGGWLPHQVDAAWKRWEPDCGTFVEDTAIRISGVPPYSQLTEGDSTSLRIPTSQEKWEAPQVLSVLSPNHRKCCSGEYTLVPSRQPNGQLLWRKKTEYTNRWLYCDIAGCWRIGDEAAEKDDFRSQEGFLRLHSAHGEDFPAWAPGPWSVLDGSGRRWLEDFDISISACSTLDEVD